MEVNGMKAHPRHIRPFKINPILSKGGKIINFEQFKSSLESKVLDEYKIEETQRSEQALPAKETLSLNQPSSEKTIEGEVKKWNENTNDWEDELFYIVLKQQQLSLYNRYSNEGNIQHQSSYPCDADYMFNEDKQCLHIYKNGEQIRLFFLENQVFKDLQLEWYRTNTKFFANFYKEAADDYSSDYFDEKNYNLKFNLPSFREFGNVYNERCMSFFQYYPIVDGKPQIKTALEFQHMYRSNRLMKNYTQQCDKKIEKYIKNRNRKFIQWTPSRDWSRLFVLSSIPVSYSRVDLYLEFYDFNNEKQTILSSPLRINLLSQLLRPQWIQNIGFIQESFASEAMIEASFTAESIIIQKSQCSFYFINLEPDWKIKRIRFFNYRYTHFDSIKLSCSKLYVKYKGFYYIQNNQTDFSEVQEEDEMKFFHSFSEDFSKTNLKNIIQCGIYDILVYDEHVKIFKNINPLNQLDEIAVNDHILQLLKSKNFIQLDHHSIACIGELFYEKFVQLQIIEISQDNLIIRQSDEFILISPWKTQQASDCKFNLIKLKEKYFAVFIVTLPSKKEQFYQYYTGCGSTNLSDSRGTYEFAYQKPLSEYINLQQIPHLPLVTINGSQFINSDFLINNYQLELDLRLDESEIIKQDQENLKSQLFEVYNPNFMKQLFRVVEEKEYIIDIQQLSEMNFRIIEIPELRTSIIIKQGGQNSGILIFQPSIDKIKYLKIKQPIIYKTHKVIYRDTSYNLSIILQTDYAFYEMRLCFDVTGFNQTTFKFIMNLISPPNQHDIYLNDDSTVSFFIQASDCCFKHFSLNSQCDQEQTIIFYFKDLKRLTIPQLSSFIQRIARNQSISFGELFLQNFEKIIKFQLTGGLRLIEYSNNLRVIAFQNKFIFFNIVNKGLNNLIIMNDSFDVIGIVTLSQKNPLSIIRNASFIDSGALECIDEFNNKFPFPILGNISDYKSYKKWHNNYTSNFGCPMPIQFGLLDGFISHLDLELEKLSFYQSVNDKKDGNISARIEIIARNESFIDDIIKCKERKEIEEQMIKININLLLSYNLKKRMNLITGTKTHAEKDHIYSVLYRLLEFAEIQELPILVYNTSVVPNIYQSILDVLIENNAIKLARLIVSIAIKQDQIGYIYSRLYQYLQIFSTNELQMFFQNQIFFFKIPRDCYEQYQIVKNTLIRPFSEYQTFFEIKKNMKNVENYILQKNEYAPRTEKKDSDHRVKDNEGQNRMEEDKAREEDMKDSDHREQGQETDQLQIMQKNLEKKQVPVQTEYISINLMNLIQSNHQSLKINNENHREVTKILNESVKIYERILEMESFQIIIDFKWDNYAFKFFSIQLGLFICFIIAFIFDIVAVSKKSNLFQSDDSSQLIPRIISIAIIIPFAIYEIAQIMATKQIYFKSFWNVNDLLLLAFYVTYFTTSFARPEQQEVLKTLQLLIVVFSFIKFSFLIRIWTRVSFLVRMLILVFKELLIFLIYFLLVIGGLTVMAQIIINESGNSYIGIKSAAFFVIVLRQSIGDYDTSSIIDGSKDFKILAWVLWLLILIIGNIVFMNFIIAVVSESYESCMMRRIQLIYKAKLEMIQECENLMPNCFFTKRNYFPRFLIIRREQGSSEGQENSDEWNGFVKEMQKHLQYETQKLNEIFIQNINRSAESTKKEVKKNLVDLQKNIADIKTSQEEVKKDIMTGQEEMKKDIMTGQQEVKKVIEEVAEVKKETAEIKVQINQIKQILLSKNYSKVTQEPQLRAKMKNHEYKRYPRTNTRSQIVAELMDQEVKASDHNENDDSSDIDNCEDY